MISDKVNYPSDLKNLTEAQLKTLCSELRQKLVDTVSETGGHLASNLGIVELTVAIHRVFNAPDDSIIFDVGHQSYVHKMLTGRKDSFSTLRKKGGISGFTRRSESEYDAFGSGHSGNSLSAAIGIATAKKLSGSEDWTVCVIGDGSFTNGMIYEGLNNCFDKDLKLVIILNDNEMSISENVGGLRAYCNKKRITKGYFAFKKGLQKVLKKIPLIGNGLISFFRAIRDFLKKIILPSNLFEDLGLDYIGPVDGHDVSKICVVLNEAKDKKCVTLVHALTKKGKGYAPAEENPSLYHSVAPFDKNTGVVPKKKETFSSVFGNIISDEAEKNHNICAVTAAMVDGTGLSGFAEKFPERFFDVGIAEEHALTFCAGLAAGGKIPVFAVYSTFAQRVFDQIIHDVSIQQVHVVLCLDHCGFVDGDGITHQGIFDVPMLSCIPDITVYSPETYGELKDCFKKAVEGNGLCVVRYPKGSEKVYSLPEVRDFEDFKVYDFGEKIERTYITYGRITEKLVSAIKENGISARVVKLIKIAPLNIEEIEKNFISEVCVVEEGSEKGGIGQQLSSSVKNFNIRVHGVNGFADSGNAEELMKEFGFSGKDIL